MSNNFSLVPLTAAMLIASGLGTGWAGYQFYKNASQDAFLLAQSYEVQTKAVQAIYLSERAAMDSSYAAELEVLDTAVERAIASLRNGDLANGIPPAPDGVMRNVDDLEKAWGEVVPSISKILSARGSSDKFTKSLAEAAKTAQAAVADAKAALSASAEVNTAPASKEQLAKAVETLQEGVDAISAETAVTTESLRAAEPAFASYVATLSALAPTLPKDRALMDPLSKSYQAAQSAQRLIVRTIDSSTGARENIPHAKTIWQARDRVASATATLLSSVQALPESRPFSALVVAALGGLTVLLSLASMVMMRSITSSRTEQVENQGRHLESNTRINSKALQVLLSEIALVGRGELSTQLTESNESTREIAKQLNIVFGRVKSILDEVSQTITGLSAAAEQTVVMDKSVAHNRGEQEKAIAHISNLFEALVSFIKQIEGMTTAAQRTSSDVLGRVRSGVDAVSQVHEGIIDLTQQTTAIQHRSKHLIESFQALEKIAAVVKEVAAKSKMVAWNAYIVSDEVGGDKKVSDAISKSADAMERLSSQANQAVQDIEILLRTMNEAARDTQSAIDIVQRETDNVRNRSNAALQSLEDINQMTSSLNDSVTQVKEDTKSLMNQSAEVNDTMSSIQYYSAENSAASEQTAGAVSNVNRQAQALQSTIAAQFAKA